MNTRIPPFSEKPEFKVPGVKDRDIPWLRRLIIETVAELRSIQEATTATKAIQ